VRIDASRKCKTVLRIKHFLGLVSLNFRREPGDLSVLDRNIEAIDRRLVRANDAGILDDGVENFVMLNS